MKLLLQLCHLIDGLNARVGRFAIWLILASTLISAGNAIVRKTLDISSNAWLEVQWYLFAWAFLLAAGYTLLNQEHVKIDVVYSRWSHRTRLWIDIFGFLCFLTPLCIVVLYLGIPQFWLKFQSGEMSNNAGGLIRWPAWLSLPIGFVLLMLQGWSEAIKRLAFLYGAGPDPTDKSGEKSAEELLADELRLKTDGADNAAPQN
ncbi:TRAP transporter small permease subunit [Ottowia sp.]|uniref:TRAP transporter small permease subunit n=1 Tax=Ottowia sp. TaxID=1898956 RepID=UPI003A87207F